MSPNIPPRFLNLYDSVSNGFYILYIRNIPTGATVVWDNIPNTDSVSNGTETDIENDDNIANLVGATGVLSSTKSILSWNNSKVLSGGTMQSYDKKFWSRNNVMKQWPVERILGDPCSSVAATSEVPTINITIETDESKNIVNVTYIVLDVISYIKEQPYNSKWNCLPINVPTSSIITTTFILDADQANILPIINSDGLTFFNKSLFLQAISPYLMLYSYTKFILARLLYGKFNINYLRRSFNKQFFTDLTRSRFNKFIEFFTSPNLVDFNGLLFNVIGYGDTPQQGYLYFVE